MFQAKQYLHKKKIKIIPRRVIDGLTVRASLLVVRTFRPCQMQETNPGRSVGKKHTLLQNEREQKLIVTLSANCDKYH